MPLQRVTDGVWELNHPFRLMRLFPLGHRMTVLRVPEGLALHSPTPLDNTLAHAIDDLGRVRHVLAPSTMHNLWLAPWGERYPDARFWTVPGFADKYRDLRSDGELDSSTRIDGLRCRTIDGMPKVNECVVLHEPSSSLLVADLVFNFPSSSSLALRALLRLVGAYGRVAPSRLFRLFVRDRAAMRRALDDILAMDFDRLIVGHGAIVETGAKDRLREAYANLS